LTFKCDKKQVKLQFTYDDADYASITVQCRLFTDYMQINESALHTYLKILYPVIFTSNYANCTKTVFHTNISYSGVCVL
jgi:hypothetical protein